MPSPAARSALFQPTDRRARLTDNDVTDEKLFTQRRRFIKASAGLSMACYLPQLALANASQIAEKLGGIETTYNLEAESTSYDDITSYNNFYELGFDKADPKKRADLLETDPWSVEIAGECDKPGTYTLEDIIAPHAFEERIYRLRCVEAWSMVIPWAGFPLADLISRFQPNSKAKYVYFETLYDKSQPLPGQQRRVLDWPYREGLTIAEAMHPLSFMVTGLYGKVLPNQNGAPLRLAVPWKYGFKSIKSIVRIEFTETQPETSWNMSAPREYGFYSNVNPNVNHPRWSQRRERVIGQLFKKDTLMFNGYEEDVASLYDGLDLAENF